MSLHCFTSVLPGFLRRPNLSQQLDTISLLPDRGAHKFWALPATSAHAGFSISLAFHGKACHIARPRRSFQLRSDSSKNERPIRVYSGDPLQLQLRRFHVVAPAQRLGAGRDFRRARFNQTCSCNSSLPITCRSQKRTDCLENGISLQD